MPGAGTSASYAAWLARIEAGEPLAPASFDVLDEKTARGEALFLGLRTADGVDAGAFAREFGAPPRSFQGTAIESAVRAGLLLENASGDLRLSERQAFCCADSACSLRSSSSPR